MLICGDCGAIFTEDEAVITYEGHPYGEGYASESFATCPGCGEGGFEEGIKCNCCGEYFLLSNMDFNENGKLVCMECLNE